MAELNKNHGTFRIKRPETPEDALSVLQALHDCGRITTEGNYVNADTPERVVTCTANPMLERVGS